MKIGIIGAGFAGLASAKVLTELGHEVTVYEKAPDVGGVWSATRRYPGLTTQNNKDSYTLSDLPMPKDYPEWPTGEQVQSYLETYVEKFGLAQRIRLGTEVTGAAKADGGGWDVTAGEETEHYDHLVVANGVYSRPSIPAYDGAEAFTGAGGVIVSPSELHDLDAVEGKHVVVVGYGKSACDVAARIAEVASTTTVVARSLLWKVPPKIKGVLNYKYLLLTRMGEGLFPYRRIKGVEKALHAGDSKVANGMVGSVESVTTKQLGLERLGLVPDGRFADIATARVSLVTPGFFEAVEDGRITVVRDTTIQRLQEKDGETYAELSTGDTIRADVVVAATGWEQAVPFLPEDVVEQITDADGDFVLYRHVHPVGVPDLDFVGYNSSFFCPLSAEVAAVWVGSLLAGNHELPSEEDMLADAREELAWARERTRGNHSRGNSVVPFSMHNIDELLADVGMDVSGMTKAKQWLLPVDPTDYRRITPKLAKRVSAQAADKA